MVGCEISCHDQLESGPQLILANNKPFFAQPRSQPLDKRVADLEVLFDTFTNAVSLPIDTILSYR